MLKSCLNVKIKKLKILVMVFYLFLNLLILNLYSEEKSIKKIKILKENVLKLC